MNPSDFFAKFRGVVVVRGVTHNLRISPVAIFVDPDPFQGVVDYILKFRERSFLIGTWGGGAGGIPRFWRSENLPPLGIGALKTCPPQSLCTEILPPFDMT